MKPRHGLERVDCGKVPVLETDFQHVTLSTENVTDCSRLRAENTRQ